MPIETDSDAWRDGAEPEDRLKKRALDFFVDNPDRAFHLRELADELVQTDWERAHEQERTIQEVGEEEYFQNLDEADAPPGDATTDLIYTNFLRVQLQSLEEQGFVEAREVPVERSDIPYPDWETVTYYALAE
ncbi:hypothetical protein ACFQH6_12180 [Halobacteriaceae archaeon GCM10025711]